MSDLQSLLRKHRNRGVCIDTNLLVLLLVGLVNPQRIQEFKRTQNYSLEDFAVLRGLVDWFGTPLISTPQVLSQVSDLAKLSGAEFIKVRELFAAMVGEVEERYVPAGTLVIHPTFRRLGLADAAIATVCEKGHLVLTADLDLYVDLVTRGHDAINFNHVRAAGWVLRRA